MCTDWTPRVPIRLYAAEDDEQAVNANSEHCRAALGAPLINLGTPDYGGSRHLGSQQAATAEVVRWFSELTATGAVPRP
ncbi:hypothetical protein AB0I98_48770 [Streptomyces sp. NPDC050211]|uniref:hypothetical protein n=1 Tax=Streptomyces sp. NPDC050211 TaxID=3154932 RepID=UPI0034464A7C